MTQDFYRLTRVGFGRGSHSHVSFIDSNTKTALCSVNRKHSHDIQWIEPQPEIPPTPEQVDPNTGEVIPANPGSPAVEGGWQVTPDPIDGHTHELEELIPEGVEEVETQDDAEIVSEVWSEWQEATELELDSMKKGDEAEDFYFGDQWDATLLARLRDEGRSFVTKNFTQKYMDDLCGVVREERKEFRYVPIEGGDKSVADLLSLIAKHILDKNYYQRERAKFFEDMCVTGKGVFNLAVDFTRDLQGDTIIERYPWRDVKFGPFEKEDLSDLEFLTKDRLFSLAKIKQLFPEKAEEVSSDFAAYQTRMTGEDPHVVRDDPYTDSPNRTPVVFGGFKNIDVLRKEIRVVERWRKTYLKTPIALSPSREFYKNCYGYSKDDVESIKTLPGFAVVYRDIPRMRITKIAGNVLLSDENPADLPEHDFFVSVGYCKRRDNRYVGKVELAKDSQMEINKRASQMIDIGNRCATHVSYIDESTFIDEKEEQRFLKHANTPGSVFRVSNLDRRPVRDEGGQFPTAAAQLMESAKGDLRELLNTTVEPWGANTTGVALQAEQRKVLRGNQFLFDALEMAEIRIGRLLIPVIQRYWTPKRVARLVVATPGKEEIDVDGTPLSNYSQEDIEALFADADLSKYDVAVAQSSYSPTTRIAVNMMLNELAKSGYPIPPQTIIRFSDLPKAEQEKIEKDIAAQSSAEGQAASETKDMEVTKSLLGQGIIPPKVQEEYQLQNAVVVGQGGLGGGAPQGGLGIGQGVDFEEEVEIKRDADGVLRGKKRKVPVQQPPMNAMPEGVQ